MASRHRNAAVFAALPLLLAGQVIDPDELRVSFAPYTPSTAAAFRSETTVVEVGVVVRDLHGDAVKGLQKADFEVFDAGKKREIISFSVMEFDAAPKSGASADLAAAPATDRQTRHIALLFDDFVVDGPPTGILKRAQTLGLLAMKAAAEQFVNDGVQPGDQYSVFTEANGQVLPFTREIAKLVNCIRNINGVNRPAMVLPTTGLSAIDGVVEYMAKIPGSRMILLASAGMNAELNPNDAALSHAHEKVIIARALAAGLVINALDGKGLFTDPPGPAFSGMRPAALARMGTPASARNVLELSNYPLATLAYGTGGSFFHSNNALLLGLKQLMLPATRYLMTFASDAPHDGRYQALKVKLTTPNHYELDTRPGYYAPKETEQVQSNARTLDRQILSIGNLAELPVTFAVQPGPEHQVLAGIHVDLRAMEFQQRADRRVQKLTFAAVLLNEHGVALAGKIASLDFALTDATFQRLAEDGVNATLALTAPAGTYRVRTVVRDRTGARISTATSQTVVP